MTNEVVIYELWNKNGNLINEYESVEDLESFCVWNPEKCRGGEIREIERVFRLHKNASYYEPSEWEIVSETIRDVWAVDDQYGEMWQEEAV